MLLGKRAFRRSPIQDELFVNEIIEIEVKPGEIYCLQYFKYQKEILIHKMGFNLFCTASQILLPLGCITRSSVLCRLCAAVPYCSLIVDYNCMNIPPVSLALSASGWALMQYHNLMSFLLCCNSILACPASVPHWPFLGIIDPL